MEFGFKICLILAMSMLALSGCEDVSRKPAQFLDRTVLGSINQYNEGTVVGEINAIRNGLAPQVKPTKAAGDSAAAPTDQSGGQQAAQGQKVQFENLAAEFAKARVKTNYGEFTMRFYSQESPVTVNNFLNLAKLGFYTGTKFHRVIKDFMVQGGDPNSRDNNWSDDGMGGPGYAFQDEFNQHKIIKGSVAMANSGANTNGSQFFILTKEAAPELDGKHSNFGEIIEGMDTVQKISEAAVDQNYHPQTDITIENIELIK